MYTYVCMRIHMQRERKRERKRKKERKKETFVINIPAISLAQQLRLGKKKSIKNIQICMCKRYTFVSLLCLSLSSPSNGLKKKNAQKKGREKGRERERKEEREMM